MKWQKEKDKDKGNARSNEVKITKTLKKGIPKCRQNQKSSHGKLVDITPSSSHHIPANSHDDVD